MQEQQSSLNENDKSFIDTSVDCAICLQPLDNAPVLQLQCGHRWHTDCIREQLLHARPNHTHRLLFSGCRCAKCGVFCEHKELEHVTRQTDRLRAAVEARIVEQLRIEEGGAALNITASAIERGRRKYAFYLCSSCNEPYFGGTVECADDDDGEQQQNRSRLCPDCAPQPPQVICRSPHEHRGSHVWKCRYCCRPAVYVCYGTVHFCQGCHDRNTERVRTLQQRQRRHATNKPPSLQPIPCRGADCTAHPKLPGESCHRNGPSPECEQVFSCAWCDSSRDQQQEASNNIPEGSPNLLINPSGALGPTRGWIHANRDSRFAWQVERSEIPLHHANVVSATNFVSSFRWSVMHQRIALPERPNDQNQFQIEASAYFMGRTDCPSEYKLRLALFSRQQQQQQAPVMEHIRQGPTSADAWERVSIVVPDHAVVNGTNNVVVTHAEVWVFGKDCRFWAGPFGAKVCQVSLRMLGPTHYLLQMVDNNDEEGVAAEGNALRRLLREHFNDVVLPVIFFCLWLVVRSWAQ